MIRLAVVVLALAGAAALLSAAQSEPAPDETIVVNINHSRFDPSSFEVAAGTTVRFVIHNGDPIDHEFILGDHSVQVRHERGTEAEHGPIPGEVSVPAGTTRSTTYTFRRPGGLIVGCHLPRHYDYGMRAPVRVTG